MWRWALGGYLPVTTTTRPRWRRTAASASCAPGRTGMSATAWSGYSARNRSPAGSELLGRQVRRQHLLQRRPELRGHLLDRELDPELRPQRPEHRGEPGHGVDERHVQVEADRELTGHA